VCRLSANANDRSGVVRDCAVVEGETGGDDEAFPAMVSGVPRGLREDSHEGVDPPKQIEGDLHQDREKRCSD
jgi:hypothetical protein